MDSFFEDFYEAWVDRVVNSRPLRSFTNNQSRQNVREILQMNENIINHFMELGRQLGRQPEEQYERNEGENEDAYQDAYEDEYHDQQNYDINIDSGFGNNHYQENDDYN